MVPVTPYFTEPFTDEERRVLARFFTELDGPVFAVVNLPEVVKGALFARYSRSPKSIRRLFLDEFHARPEVGIEEVARRLDGDDPLVRLRRAEELYDRVFTQYGDDSVAQLGGAHLACEQASNLLTKVLERGRLAAYLEQSTRYIFYDRRLGDRYRYLVPPEVEEAGMGPRFRRVVDHLFDTYSDLVARLVAYHGTLHPRAESDPEPVWRATIRAQACDDARGLLPAATLSNVGIFASGQAYEALLLRMRAHPLAEVRHYADLMLVELRKVVPSFLRRVDQPERGVAWSRYLAETGRAVEALAARVLADAEPADRPEVVLVDWDPDGEEKLAAAALYAVSDLPDDQLLEIVRTLEPSRRADLVRAYVGERRNRRHKPGRAFERTRYRFDLLTDYGIFRDLQRHRMLTIEWQRLSPRHGHVVPEAVVEIGSEDRWEGAMATAAELHGELEAAVGPEVAQYAVPFAFRIRYYLDLDAREAMHLLELRSQPSGHPGYRRVVQEMHRLIDERAGHHLVAAAMRFVDHDDYALTRLDEERRAAARRAALERADRR